MPLDAGPAPAALLQRPECTHSTRYRADIDGLRALAVLAVVTFHAVPGALPGGFVGVDIFFVISGFLITGIILQAALKGRFSYLDFYARRIRRIFPALIVMLVACAATGWFLLFTTEFTRMLVDMAAATAFAANIRFWLQTGYFAPDSALKPMLHLWSLGVEEQFYLIWPLILPLLARWRRAAGPVLVGLLVASFALNVLLTGVQPKAAFFLPAPRFWELVLGSALAWMTIMGREPGHAWVSRVCLFVERPLIRAALSSLGLALIALSLACTRAEGFPGWSALQPTVGAVLLLAAGPEAWINRRLLSWPRAVQIGVISYPLYLWHWPVLSFLRIGMADEPPPWLAIAAVLGSAGLAWVTCRVVERPLRFGPNAPAKLLGLCGAMAAIAVLAFLGQQDLRPRTERDRYVASFDNSWPAYAYSRTHDLRAMMRQECNLMDIDTLETRAAIAEGCTNPRTAHSVLVWGDSHAQHLAAGLLAVMPPSISMLQVATSSCPPSLEPVPTQGLACERSNRLALEVVAKVRPEVVILAQRYEHLVTDWSRFAAALQAMGVHRVILLGPVPKWRRDLPTLLARRYWPLPPEWIEKGSVEDDAADDAALRQLHGTSSDLAYVSLIAAMCHEGRCRAFVGRDIQDDIVTFDYGHLTPAASRWVAALLLAPIIRAAIPAP